MDSKCLSFGTVKILLNTYNLLKNIKQSNELMQIDKTCMERGVNNQVTPLRQVGNIIFLLGYYVYISFLQNVIFNLKNLFYVI